MTLSLSLQLLTSFLPPDTAATYILLLYYYYYYGSIRVHILYPMFIQVLGMSDWICVPGFASIRIILSCLILCMVIIVCVCTSLCECHCIIIVTQYIHHGNYVNTSAAQALFRGCRCFTIIVDKRQDCWS